MFAFVKKLFEDPTKDWPRSVTDGVLGELKLSEDAEYWECVVRAGGRGVGFKLGGEGKPDGKLLEHARTIVQNYPAFEKMLATFLSAEAREGKYPKAAVGEIERVIVEDICLFWPERPDDGMIWFTGGAENRAWRCDYVGRKPQGLGFDS